jgi:IS30 family transposase
MIVILSAAKDLVGLNIQVQHIFFWGECCMGRRFKQLSLEERSLIQAQLSVGIRPAAIAAGLMRSRSTVMREIRRNGWQEAGDKPKRGRPYVAGGYYAVTANQRARANHRKPRVARKLAVGNNLWQCVLDHLGRGLSPEQIALTLRRMPEPVRLSHETIYTALYAMPRGSFEPA